MEENSVPELPVLRIRLMPGQGVGVFVDEHGRENTVEAGHERTARRTLMGMAQDAAARMNRPVRVATADETGTALIAVAPDGSRWLLEAADPAQEAVGLAPADSIAPSPRSADPTEEAAAAVQTGEEGSFERIVRSLEEVGPMGTPVRLGGGGGRLDPLEAPAASEPLPTRKSLRDSQSFLAVQDNIEPARKGWQGRANAFGLPLAPGAAELAERADEHLVARGYSGPRTVAVVNQKGGAAKTPTTICLAAVFGRAGGSVLAWDNNETTGSLPWRVERGDHASSALHVLERSAHLLSDTARAADINAFVHRQTADKYDALFSDQDIDGEHEISAAEVDVLHAVASKYFNVVLMDSGNNHRAANWRQMIRHTDQLVVSTTTVEDRVEGARLTLQGLAGRNERTARLASEAVVVVSQEQPGQEKLAQVHAEKFRPYVREVHVIPFDPALKDGVIHFGALRPRTQRAWLAAAAAVAKGL